MWRKVIALEQNESQVNAEWGEVWLRPTRGGTGVWWGEEKSGHGKGGMRTTGVEDNCVEGGRRMPALAHASIATHPLFRGQSHDQCIALHGPRASKKCFQ